MSKRIRKRNNHKAKLVRYRAVEFKVKYTPFTGGIASAFGVNQAINLLAEGSDYDNRIGRKIMVSKITLNFLFTAGLDGSNAYQNHQIRLLLVLNRQSNGASVLATEVLENSNTYGLVSPYNLNYRNKYQICYDRTVTLNPTIPTKHLQVTLPFNMEMIFTNATANIDALTSRSFSVLITSNESDLQQQPTMIGYSTLRFMDA